MNSLEKIFGWEEAQTASENDSVLLTDVKGSTRALGQGRYREVNLIGAACIAAIRNEFPQVDLPFVFGGDGAVFLVPPEYLLRCREVLGSVQKMARDELALELRVAHMPVREIYQKGGDLRVGSIRFESGEKQFFFRGNGIALAEGELKSRPQFVCLPGSETAREAERARLDGLSCRVQPFLPLRGKILCVLIEPRGLRGAEDSLFAKVFEVLQRDGKLDHLSPLQKENYRRSWWKPTWILEAKLLSAGQSQLARWIRFLSVIFNTFLGNLVFGLNLTNRAIGSPAQYSGELLIQSDWVKMDGTLRMVLDLTQQEITLLRSRLETLRQGGQVYYGVHECESAVMTCHLMTPQDYRPRHTHFIDGQGGGLTRAATELKAQKANPGELPSKEM